MNTRRLVLLAVGLLLLSCSPRRVIQPTLSAPEGAGKWLLYQALEEGVEVPVVGEQMLAAIERPLPEESDGGTVVSITPQGIAVNRSAVAPVEMRGEALHLIATEGRATPEGELPEAIWKALKSVNPEYSLQLAEKKLGKRPLYIVADYRTASATLAALSIAGVYAGYEAPIFVGLSVDSVVRGFQFTGSRPCPSLAPPRLPDLEVERGMEGSLYRMAVGPVTQIGACKGLERPDWFTRRLTAVAQCYMIESENHGWRAQDHGVLTAVVNAEGNLQASSIRSAWAGQNPRLQQCVHQALSSFRAPRSKGSCVLARSFHVGSGEIPEVDLSGPPIQKPHYGLKIKWAFAVLDPDKVFMDLHHAGSDTRCPDATGAVIGWNIQGAQLDRARILEAMDGIEFAPEFLGIRVRGDVPLSLLTETADAWARKGTHVGLSVRRFDR